MHEAERDFSNDRMRRNNAWLEVVHGGDHLAAWGTKLSYAAWAASPPSGSMASGKSTNIMNPRSVPVAGTQPSAYGLPPN
ncbi:hypothetical protein PG989_000227 [Apiospora arundinis]